MLGQYFGLRELNGWTDIITMTVEAVVTVMTVRAVLTRLDELGALRLGAPRTSKLLR